MAEAKSKFKMSKAIHVVESIQNEIRCIYRSGFEQCWTLQKIQQTIMDMWDKNWKRLPMWAQCQVMGFKEAHYKIHWDRLVFTHALPLDQINKIGHIRVLAGDDRLEGIYGDLDSKQSCHCYAVNHLSQTRFIPACEEDRKNDICMTEQEREEILSKYEMLVPTPAQPHLRLVNYYR